LTHYGYVKRTPLNTYRTQRRGGRGITGLQTREEDFVEDLFVTSTHDRLCSSPPKARPMSLRRMRFLKPAVNARGTSNYNLLQLDSGERIEAFIPVKEEQFEKDLYLFMATRNGLVKKTQ
jgi:DNA gyrase subunit A